MFSELVWIDLEAGEGVCLTYPYHFSSVGYKKLKVWETNSILKVDFNKIRVGN